MVAQAFLSEQAEWQTGINARSTTHHLQLYHYRKKNITRWFISFSIRKCPAIAKRGLPSGYRNFQQKGFWNAAVF